MIAPLRKGGAIFNRLLMFSLRKKKSFFSPAENNEIVSAIRGAEQSTSGEIRVFVESKNAYVNPLDRAAEIFFQLRMDETKDRNGVLIYVAVKSREIAIYADEAIHRLLDDAYWKAAVNNMILEFRQNHVADGIAHCVTAIGQTLAEKFPYEGKEDKNELPDEIVFGK